MSPPLNPSDFPGSNPHAVQANVITNYLRTETVSDQYTTTVSPSAAASPTVQNLPEYMKRMTISGTSGHHQHHHHRSSMMIKPGHQQPLYEIVRPKSASFDEDFKLLKSSPSSSRVENDYQSHPYHHQRQNSDGNPVRRPPVPPPLPPVNPRPIMDDSCLTRAHAHLMLQPPSTPTCVPWLKKVKVIKNIKRKIGIGKYNELLKFYVIYSRFTVILEHLR